MSKAYSISAAFEKPPIINGRPLKFVLKEDAFNLHDGKPMRRVAGKTEDVLELAVREAKRCTWYLSKSYPQEKLRQLYNANLAEDRDVKIFNFMQRNLERGEIELMAESLAFYYHAMKEKSLWRVDSVQIEAEDGINRESGKPYRGYSCPEQERFMVFPISFTPTDIWGRSLGLPTLKHISMHEATHVNLSHVLMNAWLERARELGWEMLDGMRIRLPGGAMTNWFNSMPKRCPTDYGALLPDEDIPESVVAYLNANASLDSIRSGILSRFLDPSQGQNTKPKVTELEPRLPEIPTFIIDIHEPLVHLFGELAVIEKRTNHVIELEELRRQRGIQ